MKKAFGVILLIVLIGGLFTANLFLYTVDQRQQAIVLYFGKPDRVVTEPGLHVRIPVAEEVRYFDTRILDLDPPEVQVPLVDKKRINVDAYMRYQIIDPLLFFQAVTSESGFQDRFGRQLNSALQQTIARSSLSELLSDKRDDIMAQISTEINLAAPGFGVKIIDIRIGRTDLPVEISQNVYGRMRAEREREARELRAEGNEEAQKITARADREKVVLVADAKRKSEILRGEGEGERITTLANAYGRDPEFFDFYKSMQEYRNSLGGDSTTMVLTPDSDFFRFFGQETPRK
ncbi:MAG: protease modulator HflC [Alphaproteobacteria bacterium]|nr:protease modulator HflC [Alphaproteobacteria bacterium]